MLEWSQKMTTVVPGSSQIEYKPYLKSVCSGFSQGFSILEFFRAHLVNLDDLNPGTVSINVLFIQTIQILMCTCQICVSVTVVNMSLMIMGCILHVKSSTSANQCLSTKHRRRKPRVLRSVSSEHGPPVRCNSLIPDVVMETDLCKDVAITVSDFQQALGANATETQCYRYTCFKNTLEKPVFEKTAWYVHTAINAEKLNFFQLLKTSQDT